jgi:hypothetical protein
LKANRSKSFVAVALCAVLALGMGFGSGCSSSESGSNRDLILVLDTSRSMIGQGGKNIFSEVKGSLKKFVDELKPGDTITIMTFDEKVRTMPTMKINDDNDKIIINNMITSTQAEGMWTYTMGMLRDVFKMAQEMEVKGKAEGRQQVIVMLTDGLDDPPPSRRREKFNIKDAAKGYMGKEWYIYLVNFGDLKKNSRFQEVQSELQKSVTANVQLLEGGKSPSGAVSGVQSLQQQREADQGFFGSALFWAIIIIIILLLLFWLFQMYSKIKVAGSLEYYNYTLLDPYVNVANLDRFHLKEVLVGKTGSDLNLRDFDNMKPFVVKAYRSKGKILNKLVIPEGLTVEFVNRDAGEFLNNGDVFKIANYSFKFIAQEG